jgi:catechol 2,3-dioxygenase-like lactoylglutathione lyase family enzyme
MRARFDRLAIEEGRGGMSRREVLKALPVLALAPSLAPKLFAQGPASILTPSGLNHITLSVSDVKRSLDFYQGLFGMPIQAREGSTVCLAIGDGPQYLALGPAGSGRPSLSDFCMGIVDFNVERAKQVLSAHGVSEAPKPGGGLAGGPMHMRERMRGPQEGGDPEGTREFYFGDPDGIVVQLQDPSYCGGAGVLGNICRQVEPSPKKGLMAVRGLSHFTISVADAARSNKFYQDVFGLDVQARQGPTAPLLGVGPGVSFVMFTGGAGAARGNAAPRPASINHFCMNMENFDPDVVMKTLESYGIKDRAAGRGPVGPMEKYVSMRMPNRGGAPDGTPELYFTDPDGLLVQLQDVKYCGGGGHLGDESCS